MRAIFVQFLSRASRVKLETVACVNKLERFQRMFLSRLSAGVSNMFET